MGLKKGFNDKQKRERCAEIVKAAAQLFTENGIDSVKMTEIAELSRVGVASVYRYFGTKTAIAVEVGILLWNEIHKGLNERFESGDYEKLCGIEQISLQLSLLAALYSERKGFIMFLDELDRLLLSEDIDQESLAEYDKSIIDIRKVFLSSCEKGVEDGSVRAGLDYELIYRSMTHGLIALSQKLLRGEVLPADDFTFAEAELRQLEKMAVFYLKNN